jgi:hypothetical protein
MIKSSSNEHPTNRFPAGTRHGIAASQSDVESIAGRSAYREDYECDHGPDPDESLDAMESGREFWVQAMRAAAH